MTRKTERWLIVTIIVATILVVIATDTRAMKGLAFMWGLVSLIILYTFIVIHRILHPKRADT
ncbi:MAG: hypothetical protein Q7R67_00735 [bacterium]|nr:hypothetical protein [bacterium]